MIEKQLWKEELVLARCFVDCLEIVADIPSQKAVFKTLVNWEH
jgi:hypothetical protein